jgi:aspartate/methionine/tyrosine aminotransferase
MTFKCSDRSAVPPFIVMDVLHASAEREATGAPVFHLAAGQPSLGVPAAVTQGLKDILDRDPIGYTVSLGLPALRQKIAEHYRTSQGVEIAPERVVVTTGSSGGFILAFASCFNPGDRVGLAMPGYPAYPSILKSLGIEPVRIPVGPDSRYQPTVEVLEALGEKLDGLIVASPSNPTGTVMPAADMERLCQWCEANGVRLISDEIYHGITFDQPAVTAARYSSSAVLINSFSKYFCMTGWRLGWLVVPEDMVRPLECLTQNLFISAPTLSQYAGILAFDHIDEFERRVQGYAANRELLLKALPAAGITQFAPPDGAFYLYADVAHLTNDSLAFCQKMLAECGVAAAPGVDFDPVNGGHCVRFSFARSLDHMTAAMDALSHWLAKG